MNNQPPPDKRSAIRIALIIVALILVVAGWWLYNNFFSNQAVAEEDWGEICQQVNSGVGFGGMRQPPANFDPSSASGFDASQRPDSEASPRPNFNGGMPTGDFASMQTFRTELESACADGTVDSGEAVQLEQLMADMPEQVQQRFFSQ